MGGRHYSDLIVVGFIGVVGTFIVLYAEEWIFRESAWCIAGEDHCLREWVGALSGWVGAVAAFVTVLYLIRQIKEANRHQRENLELQIMGRLALCRRVDRELNFRHGSAEALSAYAMAIKNAEAAPLQLRVIFNAHVQMLVATSIDLLQKFDDEIGIEGSTDADYVRHLASQIKEVWPAIESDVAPAALAPAEVMEALGDAMQKALADYQRRADEFVEVWRDRIREGA